MRGSWGIGVERDPRDREGEDPGGRGVERILGGKGLRGFWVIVVERILGGKGLRGSWGIVVERILGDRGREGPEG